MGNEADYFFLFFCRKWADDVGNTVSSCSQRIVFFSKKLATEHSKTFAISSIRLNLGATYPFFDTRQSV